MILFTNDYNRGAHPAILAALSADADSSHIGYGKDDWCAKARESIAMFLGDAKAEIHFLSGGTQVNATVIAAGLRPYQSVLSAASGHIAEHETGAIERGGHKVEVLPSDDGKLSAKAIAAHAQAFTDSTIAEHICWPKMVYISFPTEFGTLYTLAELEAIAQTCRRHGLYLFVDGARLGYGLTSASNDVTMADLARLADAFTIGGTKCGALFGEAAVLVNPELRTGFRSLMKQSGALLAKGWLLGLQFATLFSDELYFTIAAQANQQAQRIRQVFNAAGIDSTMDSPTNQQFFTTNSAQMTALGTDFGFEYWGKLGEDRHCLRFCTSWSTRDEEIDALESAVARL